MKKAKVLVMKATIYATIYYMPQSTHMPQSTARKSKGLRCSGTGSSTLKIISAWPQAKGDMQ